MASKSENCLTLNPVRDILQINFLKEKSFSKLLPSFSEREPVLKALGQLGSWDIPADSGGGGDIMVFTDHAATSVIIHCQEQRLSRSLGKCPSTPNFTLQDDLLLPSERTLTLN